MRAEVGALEADLVVDREGRKKQELLARDNAIASKPAFALIPFL